MLLVPGQERTVSRIAPRSRPHIALDIPIFGIFASKDEIPRLSAVLNSIYLLFRFKL